jgi:penicillin-binding protein 1A
MSGARTADVPPFVRSDFACAASHPANDGSDRAATARAASGDAVPAAVDGAERVLDMFRTGD